MAIAFRAAGTGANASGAITPGLPSGWQPDDLCLYVISISTTDDLASVPGGWSSLASQLTSSSLMRLRVIYRTLQSGDAAPTLTPTAGSIAGRSYAWSGVSTSTPFDVTAVTGTGASGTTVTPTGVTTVTDGAVALSIVGTSDNNTLDLQTAQSFTVRGEFAGTAGLDHATAIADKTQATAGEVTFPTWQQTALGPDQWAWISTALRPAVSAAFPFPARNRSMRALRVR